MNINEINLDEEKPYNKIDEEKIKYDKKTRQLYWNIAIGLNDVDNLKPSQYFKELIKENVEENKSNYEIELAIKAYYKEKEARQQVLESELECDMVSLRIKELLEDESFVFSPVTLKLIHKYLFQDVYDFAGKFRTYNITKEEVILNNDTVNYANYMMIEDTFDYDFKEEKKFDYANKTLKEQLERIAEFTSSIWQIHAFDKGNTRTTVVFIEKYLRSKGYPVTNEIFKEHSLYFRNALVRANYSNYAKKVYATNEYLIRFFENLLMNKQNVLHNRDLIVKELFEE